MMTDLRMTLRGSGKRMTAQRSAVYEALCDAVTHPTAEELFFFVRDRLPGISLATIYNTLETLVASGLAVKLPGEGAAHYDAVCDPHGHARCTRCGALSNLPGATVSQLLTEAELPEGFVPHAVLMSVEGLCPTCAGATEGEDEKRRV